MKRKFAAITESQIQLALRQYQCAGGRIRHMGDQPSPRRDAITLPWGPLLGISQVGALRASDAEGTAGRFE
jgi:hypothetical protein